MTIFCFFYETNVCAVHNKYDSFTVMENGFQLSSHFFAMSQLRSMDKTSSYIQDLGQAVQCLGTFGIPVQFTVGQNGDFLQTFADISRELNVTGAVGSSF